MPEERGKQIDINIRELNNLGRRFNNTYRSYKQKQDGFSSGGKAKSDYKSAYVKLVLIFVQLRVCMVVYM